MIRSLLTTVVTAAAVSGLLAAPAATASRPTAPDSLSAGHAVSPGHPVRSRDGRNVLSVSKDGRARLMRDGHTVWRTPAIGPGAVLLLRPHGNLVLLRHGRTGWQSATQGAGPSRLLVGDGDGTITLANRHGTVWSSALGNGCHAATRGHEVLVDISRQRAWFCSHHQQVLTTSVTTGAVDRGDGTPTGTWRVYHKTRDTTLYPASGGAYPVRFWMPYSGPYGLHDSPWQHFRYGSERYRKHGSHGCVHVPETAMHFLFDWAPVGTTVQIHH